MKYNQNEIQYFCNNFRNEPVKNEPAKAPIKSELQVLRLPDTFKTEIMDTLKHIRGQTFRLGQKTQYKDMGTRLKKGYWEERGNLVVQSVSDFSRIEKSGCEKTDRSKVIALSKLESYGFDGAHCIEALEHCKGDEDGALEVLYKQYFQSIFNCETTQHPEMTENEVNEMRSDEMAALQSIYDADVINEKEKNKLWLFKFKIDHLLVYSDSEQKKRSLTELEEQKRKRFGAAKKLEKCRNFKATGKCKYGTKCKFSHVIDADKPTMPESDSDWFYLEFRFPKGNLYPYHVPLIALKTTYHDISKVLCLRITRRCLEEAKLLATDGMPSVYTIADLLQNEQEITEFLKNDKYQFPDPKKSIFHTADENENQDDEVKPNLPSHYKKGSTGRTAQKNVSADKMLKDDIAFSESFAKRRTTIHYKEMQKVRQSLPAWSKSNEILNAITSSQVIVISGEKKNLL